jgi:hypothetical protein
MRLVGRAQEWTLRDRPARDDEDLGDVYEGGELVGKVYREFVDARRGTR